ncbi:hypothetical protein LUZ61_011837 [Rhynchospora tenuis]|uniref:Uncharacterized protein n=1 Tax=Rhynchospora tenuis TaxID=198213 RepID=A0AAD6F0J5_9POAL|nr:hypothetical protein LUZ61_011837 [Rhynchospora tenuis]
MAQIHLIHLLSLLTFFSLSTAARFPAVIVFGDSTVDPGNNNAIDTILRSNFPPYGRDFKNAVPTGRFSNGKLPTDFISEALGLQPLVPAYLDPACSIENFTKGVAFASSGAGLDNATSNLLTAMSLGEEVEYFKEYQHKLRKYVGKSRANYIVNEAVYIVSIGTNDFLSNYFTMFTGRFLQFTVDKFEDFLVSHAAEFLTNIYKLGARKILFAGLSPIGCLPVERSTNLIREGQCKTMFNEVARNFNAKLQRMIADLGIKFPGLRLIYGGVYDLFSEIINNPSRYGIENVEDGCCATGKFEVAFLCDSRHPLTCRDASKYLFWDAFHPTEKTNYLIGDVTLHLILRELI